MNTLKLVAPLTALTKKHAKFKWTNECQTAFDTLKQRLISAPILVFPDFNRSFVLSVDASDTAIGYVLGQLDHETKREHVVAYGGRALHHHEKKWHINEKEGLALREAVFKFKPYLSNKAFKVYTDNITVKWLDSIKTAESRLGRWATDLQAFNFEIIHRPGKKNNADALSRRDYPAPATMPDLEDDIPQLNILQHSQDCMAATFEYPWDRPNDGPVQLINIDDAAQADPPNIIQHPTLKHLQQQCPDLAEIINYKLHGSLPNDKEKGRQLDAKAYHFEIVDSILYHFYPSQKCSKTRKNHQTTSSATPTQKGSYACIS